MGGWVRTSAGVVLGGALAHFAPRAGMLAATQEIIAFLALLMAGLLPAMILTATILRSAGMSAARVGEYGRALRLQLHFWAGLFGMASLGALGIVVAKIFSAKGVVLQFTLFGMLYDQDVFTGWAVVVAGAATGLVVVRLYPAYEGLLSLLDLNVTMAKAEALANDRSKADALGAELRASKGPQTYRNAS